MTVSTILARKGRAIYSFPPEMNVREATRFLSDKGIGAALVRDASGKMLGIVSERDLVRAIAAQGAESLNKPVSGLMTTKVISCMSSDPIQHVMGLMTVGRFRHLPVVDDGQLTGMISIGDVVKARIADAEAESQQLKDYIQLAS